MVVIVDTQPKRQRSFGGGARIKIPPGDTVISLARHAMSLHTNAEKASKAVGLSRSSFVFVRQLLTLKDKGTLTTEELAKVEEALNEINKERRINKAEGMVNGIIKKYWTPKTTNGRTKEEQKLENKTHARLESTLFLIREACTNNDEMKIPMLTQQQKSAAIETLAESIAGLADLINKIKRGERDA